MEINEKTFDRLSISLIIIAIIIIVFSFFAPILFVQESIHFNFSESGNIGNTIGGLMSPFIAISGIILTFLAFYIQLIANKLLKQQIIYQNEHFRKNQIETQFYEMLKLHKENLKDIFIIINKVGGDLKIVGRDAFQFFINEVEILYQVEKRHYIDKDIHFLMGKAFLIFLYGISKSENEINDIENKMLEEIQHKTESYNKIDVETFLFNNGIKGNGYHYRYFSGFANKLEHYYRHLYQTVKFITSQDKLVYNEKMNFLKILRAQLSNQEQLMLFYSWISGFGSKWENEQNKYFSEYKMIQNIPDSLLFKDFKLDNNFKKQNNNILHEVKI